MPTLTLADRVAETTTTTGTGTLDLAGAVGGAFRTFVAGAGTGAVVPYVIVHRTANEWEVGYGTVTDGTPDTLSRTAVYSSSNANALVNFSAGTKDVYLAPPAARTVRFDDATQAPVFPGTVGVGGAAPSSSGAGISFPATQSESSDANTLDDYEEGSWTPVAVCTGQTITYTDQVGNYTKIGNLVRATVALRLNTVSGAAGGLTTITGLPFSNGGPTYSGNAAVGYNDGLTNAIESAWVNGTTIQFRTGDRSSANDSGGFTAGGFLNLEILYRV